jgi:hypothetical protein
MLIVMSTEETGGLTRNLSKNVVRFLNKREDRK